MCPWFATAGSAQADRSEIPEVDQSAAIDFSRSLTPGSDLIVDDRLTLDAVAESNGTSTAELVAALASDETLWVDADGVLLAIDPLVEGIGNLNTVVPSETSNGFGPLIRSAALAGPQAGPIPALAADQTFALHSRLGASKTAYLDFNGRVVSGTAWNDSLAAGANIVVPAWDFDGSPGTFSGQERAVVLDVWRRVSEDFAPFDIDITTAEPPIDQLLRSSPADQNFGTSVVVSPPSVLDAACDCAGVSYVGTVDRVGDNVRYEPSLVFSQRLGASSAKHLGEAISHEIGHGFGLGHVAAPSGSTYYGGEGAWAPIMGISYDRPITQWLADDVVIGKAYREIEMMARHGLGGVLDDHGDSPARATSLGGGPSIAANGLISTRADVDVFSFTTSGGPIDVAANVDDPGANLDIKLDLLAPTGAVIVSANPESDSLSGATASGLGASISTNVPAGTYFVRVDGVGSRGIGTGGYSDQGSLGKYSLLGAIPSTTNQAPIPIATINATVWGQGATIEFDSSGSTDPDGRIAFAWWDFGDGSVSIAPKVTKTFASTGSFAVVLTVVDDLGAVASSAVLVAIGANGGVISAIDIAGEPTSTSQASRVPIASSTSPTPAAAPLPGDQPLALPADRLLPETG
jgi:PKD domain/Bacterial pre-peptidase C-terminal domain